MAFNSDIGHIVADWRHQAGLSQRQLADEIGVSSNTISRIENGYQGMTASELVKISQACNADLNETKSCLKEPRPIWERINE